MSEQERAVPAPAGGIEVPLGGLQEGSTGLVEKAVPAPTTEHVYQPAVQTATTAVPTADQNVPNVQPTPVVSKTNDILLEAVGVTGEGLNGALEKALQHGDPSLINITELTKGMSETQAATLKHLAESRYQEIQTHISTSVSQVQQLAGGVEQWNAVRSVFNAKAPAHIAPIIEGMIANGDIVNAGKFMIDFAKQNGLVNSTTQPAVQGGVGAVQQGISNADYKEAVYKLTTEYPNQSLEGNGKAAQEFKKLQAQRALGRQSGI